MKGDDASHIKQGNTLSDDQLVGHQFNFMLANPEFGTDWKKIEDTIRKEAARGDDGRFGLGSLPSLGESKQQVSIRTEKTMRMNAILHTHSAYNVAKA